jgi:hypothetical protein
VTFPYPPDDPAEVSAVVTALRAAARPQAAAVEELCRYSVRERLPWQSSGGDAAVAEVGRLAGLCADAATGLRSAAAALTRYRDALLRARSGVDRLNEQYSAAFMHRQRAAQSQNADGAGGWSADLAGFERSHHAVLADLDTVSRQTAQTLRRSLKPIGGGPDEAGMIRTLARRLPMWAQHMATELAGTAAHSLDPGHVMTPQARAAFMQKYVAWQDDPVFAEALLEHLGSANFRTLLAIAVPQIYTPKMADTLHRYYGFLGHVLSAAPLSGTWLAGLTDKLANPDNHVQRIGLGLALRYGTYPTRTISTIAPVLYSARSDTSIDIRLPFGDPLIGVLHALSTDPAAAAEFLRDERNSVSTLLSRIWREDDGRALGALLAATSTLHNDAGARIAEDTVHWVAGHVDSTPAGLYSGLGELLGNYIDDVNHGLIDLNSGAPVAENALPAVSPPPHAQFSQSDVMRAIYVAMQSTDGSVSIYSHQAVYAAEQLERQTHSRGPSTVLSEIAVNYGRLSKIHELTLIRSATLANASDAERRRNSTTWITIASTAAGVLPIPGISGVTSIAAGFTKSRAVNYFAHVLQQRYYAKPLGRDSARRFDHADQLAIEEEKATKKYVATLTKRLGGDSSNKWISSQSIGAGRDNAEYLMRGVK